ncbi:hypothetical protein QBC39DRAFT_409304 [Podospora conica]|nr:hypothetical protein QBC39DRAFT_409304 [Schizothecium conicum]
MDCCSGDYTTCASTMCSSCLDLSASQRGGRNGEGLRTICCWTEPPQTRAGAADEDRVRVYTPIGTHARGPVTRHCYSDDWHLDNPGYMYTLLYVPPFISEVEPVGPECPGDLVKDSNAMGSAIEGEELLKGGKKTEGEEMLPEGEKGKQREDVSEEEEDVQEEAKEEEAQDVAREEEALPEKRPADANTILDDGVTPGGQGVGQETPAQVSSFSFPESPSP